MMMMERATSPTLTDAYRTMGGGGDDDEDSSSSSSSSVSVVIPVLNEEASLPILLDFLATKCTPQPNEIIVSDGGSTDDTLVIAQQYQQEQQEKKNDGMKVIVLVPPSNDTVASSARHDEQNQNEKKPSPPSQRPCRALSLNRGLQAATCHLVIFIHADTLPPYDFVVHMRNIMCTNNNNNKKIKQRQRRVVSLSAFPAIIVNDDTKKKKQVNSFITFHHYIKTYYGPLLLYPYQFIFKGLLCFFGDQCMFGRRTELLEVGGYDLVPVLEEGSLCKKMIRFGPLQMCSTTASCTTSDRRIALYGTLKVTLLHVFLTFGFELFGVSLEWLSHYYPPQQVLEEQFRLNNVVYQHMRFNHWAERQFLWKEIVHDRCYDHAKLSFNFATKRKWHPITNGSHDKKNGDENGNNGNNNNNESIITIIDVGANVGLFSCWMANSSKLQAASAAAVARSSNSTASSITIHALEPSPYTYQLLKSNVAKVQQAAAIAQQQQQQQAAGSNRRNNNTIRIVPHQLAISTEEEKELTFTTYPRCSGWSTFHRDEASLYHDLHSYLTQRIFSLFGSTLGNLINGTLLKLIYPWAFRLLTSGASTTTVPVTNLSSFIQQHNIQRIDLLKIDVERHEYQVLLGIRDSDWTKIQAIVMEAEVHQSDILELLRERGGFDIVEETKDAFMAKTSHSIIWALRRHQSS